MENKINIKVIIGSTRQSRFSDKPAVWIFEKLKKIEGVEAELIDLRDWPLPFYNEALPPIALAEKYTEPIYKKWADKVREGDAYIVVTPEYNHGYPAVLKNALDVVFFPWNDKPIGFVSHGTVMGARAVEQLRLVAVDLSMVPIRNSIHLAPSWELSENDGSLKEGAFEPYENAAAVFLAELVRWAEILKSFKLKK